MNDIQFRKCTERDLTSVQELVDALYERFPGEDGVLPDIRKTYVELARHPEKGVVIVFEKNKQIVGYSILIFFWSNEFNGDVIEIDELLVAEAFRGFGYGRRFLAWLEANYASAVALALQVSTENAEAQNLYRSVGFRDSKNQHLIKLFALAVSNNSCTK